MSLLQQYDKIVEGPRSNHQTAWAGVDEKRQEEKYSVPTWPEPVPASRLQGGESVPWLWHGYLAKGYSTLFSGVWKGGKSTMLAHLLQAMGDGGELGGAVEAGRVLIVSEEGAGLWATRRDALGLGDHCEFLCRPFKGRPRYGAWLDFVDHLARLVVERRFDAVVFDTWSAMSPCPDENDAAQMLTALTPLNRITEAGAAVLLIHHPRKSDGAEGMASRGSGALTGFVDCIMELRRFAPGERQDRRRTLTAYSRFDETPAEAVVELTEHGYLTVGSKAEARKADRLATLADMLPTEGPGFTVQESLDAWPQVAIPKPGVKTMRADLAEGARAGLWLQSGAGTKGDPHRYQANSVPVPPPRPEACRNRIIAPERPESTVDSIPARSTPIGRKGIESGGNSSKPGHREPDRDENDGPRGEAPDDGGWEEI